MKVLIYNDMQLLTYISTCFICSYMCSGTTCLLIIYHYVNMCYFDLISMAVICDKKLCIYANLHKYQKDKILWNRDMESSLTFLSSDLRVVV